MVYTIATLPDEPIIIVTFTPPFDPLVEFLETYIAIGALVADMPQPVIYRVVDMAQTPVTFSQVVEALAIATRSPRAPLRDPRMRSVYVATGEMALLARESLKQPQYGGFHIDLFPAQAAALQFVREQLTQGRADS
ncbi:MAG: hypothetical protein MUE40_21545 [Anaerolineae bacterium]|jgi:hypothetical protein|nr:hypothetical protein [Anaerolineae bacterium]